MKNGKLIVAAEAAGFEVIVTIDQSIPLSAEYRSATHRDPDSPRSHQSASTPKADDFGGARCACSDSRSVE
ncbi:MAG: hypothetical protein M3Y57_18750 [Acidobacteriota bacterium]|nr:hypothetical protein [Acidobacteriota bacterium]